MDPEIFFSEDEERESKKRTEREIIAKKICEPCQVSGNCLDWALRFNEIGVWGGTSTQEREKIKRIGHRVSCVRCSRKRIDRKDDYQVCLSCGLSWLV